jgi:hypothetical protein
MFLVQNLSGNWQGMEGTLKKNCASPAIHCMQQPADEQRVGDG